MRSSIAVMGAVLAGVLLSMGAPGARAEMTEVPFDSGQWDLSRASVEEHLGRACVAGAAVLNGVEFADGVIEVDVAVDGGRSYPGILFRMETPGDYEHVYIRPHRAGLYSDAMQYAPSWNGIGGWQLENGEGSTGPAVFPENEWFTLRLEVSGESARLVAGDGGATLEVHRLERGVTSGEIGLSGPQDGSAYFSTFRYDAEAAPDLGPPPIDDAPPGGIMRWELSTAFPASRIDRDSYPLDQDLEGVEWSEIEALPGGLVDVSRHTGRTGREPDCVLAKTTIHAERAGIRQYVFGYSDLLSVYLNGRPVFEGMSAYQSRDPSFLGIVGPFDALYLPLEAGENELLLAVVEAFGGWAFMARDVGAELVDPSMAPAWETGPDFLMPESAVYDAERDVLYVSNYDAYRRGGADGTQFISKLGPTGEILALEWVRGLANPTGLALFEGRLYAVERGGLAVIDPDEGRIVERLAVDGAGFLNDVAIAPTGEIFVSDTRASTVFRSSGGDFEPWIEGEAVGNPNGLCIDGDALVVGVNADRSVKAVPLAGGEPRTIARFGDGTIDGILLERPGTYLVSFTEGKLFRLTDTGEATKLMDTTVSSRYVADFARARERGLIIVPRLARNTVAAYSLDE